MTRTGVVKAAGLALAVGLGLYSSARLAAEHGSLSGADTAWILTSTALVLFMTLPGLALFYGGLVRAQAVLSVLMHCFTICCLASLLWLFGVYSLAFGNGGALGSLLTAVFAATSLGGMGLAEGTTMGGQLMVQILGIVVVAAWSGIATFVMVKIIGLVVALRVSEEEEIEGLDIVSHGERAYELQTLAR